ncbi:MAG TPA: sulfite exporter TauE/SafE family protein [Burkholderiales bacterium]|nr:sulfite exporter TauE/SafE family protein [Burkholderiales bacterium]
MNTMLYILAFLIIGGSLGFLGGGGSILMVPLLVYGLHIGPKEAIATSMIVVGIVSAIGALRYYSSGRLEWKKGLAFGLSGMTGAYMGGQLSFYIPAIVLLALLSLMMISTGAVLLRHKAKTHPHPKKIQNHNSTLRTLIYGLGTGSLTGLLGAGGGFIIVPALVLLEDMEITSAIPVSLMIIALNCMAGIFGYLQHMNLNLYLTGRILLATLVGCIIGCVLSHHLHPESLRKIFAVSILLTAAFQVFRLATPFF